MADSWLANWPGVASDEPLGKQSQYGIGGLADWFAAVDSLENLCALRRRCHEEGVAFSVIGAGSNTLILDGGIRGLVVRLTEKRLQRRGDSAVSLSAAYMMPRAALDCAKAGLAGLEFGIGVPGTCGASVIGNAGAFSTEVADALTTCVAMTPEGELRTLSNLECGFSYRFSRFKSDLRDHVVVSAEFAVHPDDPAAVKERTNQIQTLRKASQPYGSKSLGSVFKNPEGDHAGRLIEACGLKGARSGGAQISEKHANFIINSGHASAADVLKLVELAHDAVVEQFGIDMQREIVVMGEEATANA